MSLFNFFKDLIVKCLFKETSFIHVFDHYFFDLKYYLHLDASNEDFSNLLNISTERLDQISIEKYSCSFSTLLNENRYKHLIKELENPLNARLTIDSLMKLNGYSNNQKFVDYLESKEAIPLPIIESFSK